MVSDFSYYAPVRILFGAGRFSELSKTLAELGVKSAVLVCGGHFAPEAEKLMKFCPEVRALFSGVEPNPQLSGAAEAARLARGFDADAVIGVGGGSALDTAKFAAAVALGDRPVEDYYNGAAFPANRLRMIAVPTTAGTGSEVTQVSVMNNGAEKRTINDPAFMPAAAVVDPRLSLSVPPRTTMMTGLDALAHALEGYWSRQHQSITDLYAIEAVRLILENLERAYTDGGDLDARSGMAYAATLAGLAFAQSKTAGCHACSYPLSMDYHLPHGEACAFTLSSFVRINADGRLETLCRRAGLGGTEALAEAIDRLKALAGLRRTLGDIGCADTAKLSADCAAHPLMGNNPVPMDAAALERMFDALK